VKEMTPCEGCVFIEGTEANRSEYTRALFEACVEGITPFYCHERPDVCRGWVGAVNARWAGVDLTTEETQRHITVSRMGAEILGICIETANVAGVFRD
jgi:hypothetical protein